MRMLWPDSPGGDASQLHQAEAHLPRLLLEDFFFFFFVQGDQNKNDKEGKTDRVSRKKGQLSERTDVSRDKLSVSDGNGSCHLSGLQFRGRAPTLLSVSIFEAEREFLRALGG